MRDNGLFSLCGVPGSGKTLTTVRLALKHYKNENSPFKFYLAYFKYYCFHNKFINFLLSMFKRYNIFRILKDKYNNFCIKATTKIDVTLVKVTKILFKLISFFIKFVVLILIYVVPNWFIKIILFLLLFFRNKFYKFFDTLDYDYFCLFPYKKINNIYSTFPILLDKKRNIYSHKITLWDLDNLHSFLPNSIIILDEIQLFVDSDEYKNKELSEILRKIGNYFQAHRHFGIKNIYVTSQGTTRIFKKCRDVCSGYLKLNRVIKVPLIPFGLISGTMYYDIDYFGKYIPRSREERKRLPFDYKKIRIFCNLDKLYKSYDSRYLANLNYDKPLLTRGYYNSLRTNTEDLKNIFNNPYQGVKNIKK